LLKSGRDKSPEADVIMARSCAKTNDHGPPVCEDARAANLAALIVTKFGCRVRGGRAARGCGRGIRRLPALRGDRYVVDAGAAVARAHAGLGYQEVAAAARAMKTMSEPAVTATGLQLLQAHANALSTRASGAAHVALPRRGAGYAADDGSRAGDDVAARLRSLR
jgi:hypothetical protein